MDNESAIHTIYIQGGSRKVKPTTILLVTFEWVGKIQWFLADVNCIQQEVVRCKFYANFVIINTWHARWRHIRSTQHWNHWANGGKQPQNSPLSLEALRPPSNTWMSGVTPLTILNDSSIAARTSAQLCQLCNKVTRLGTPIAYLWRQNVTFIEPDMWPPSSPNLNPVDYTIWVVLHFLLYAVYICQKSLNFYLHIQMLPAKL